MDSSRVCSDHFRPHDYDNESGRKIVRLKPSAIPSLFTGQESGTQAVENHSQHVLEKVNKSPTKLHSIVVSQSQQIPQLLEEESDIKLARNIMDHLGLSGNTSFDMLAKENQGAVGSRLELILGIVANGALVSLINSVLNDSDVEDLASMKGMLASNSDTSITEEPLGDMSLTGEGHSSREILETESSLKLGKISTGLLSNTVSLKFINLDLKEELIETLDMPYSASKDTIPSESTGRCNGGSMSTQMETLISSQGHIQKDTSVKTPTKLIIYTRCQKSQKIPKRQSSRLKAKEIIKSTKQTHNDDEDTIDKADSGYGDVTRTPFQSSDTKNQIHTGEDVGESAEETDDKVAVLTRSSKKKNPELGGDLGQCPSCRFTGLDWALRKHYGSNHQKRDKKTFAEAKREKEVKSDPLACKICGLKFRKYISLRSHNKRIHKKEIEKESDGQNQIHTKKEDIYVENEDKVAMTSTPTHLRNHKMTMSLHCSYSACGILFPTIKEKRRHERSVHKPKVHCDKCGKVFIGSANLNLHVKVVHDRMSLDLKCTFPDCDKVFTNRSMRTRHINITHFPNKYKCETCNKTCGSLKQLRDHGIVHSGERNFQCQDCERKFRCKTDLLDHKRSHTGEKPFACQHCPYRGGSSSLLYHHMRQKHRAEFEDEKKEKERARIKISTDVLSDNTEGNEKTS